MNRIKREVYQVLLSESFGYNDLYYFPYLPPLVRYRVIKKMKDKKWKRKTFYTVQNDNRHYLKRGK